MLDVTARSLNACLCKFAHILSYVSQCLFHDHSFDINLYMVVFLLSQLSVLTIEIDLASISGGPRVHDGGQHEGPHVLLRGGRLQHRGQQSAQKRCPPCLTSCPHLCQYLLPPAQMVLNCDSLNVNKLSKAIFLMWLEDCQAKPQSLFPT